MNNEPEKTEENMWDWGQTGAPRHTTHSDEEARLQRLQDAKDRAKERYDRAVEETDKFLQETQNDLTTYKASAATHPIIWIGIIEGAWKNLSKEMTHERIADENHLKLTQLGKPKTYSIKAGQCHIFRLTKQQAMAERLTDRVANCFRLKDPDGTLWAQLQAIIYADNIGLLDWKEPFRIAAEFEDLFKKKSKTLDIGIDFTKMSNEYLEQLKKQL